MFGTRKKDEAFFRAFSDHSAKSVEAARHLVEMLTRLPEPSGTTLPPAPDAGPRSVDATLRDLAAKIDDAEHAGDRITHETIKRLRENWITPLDRADIHDLIRGLDDVLDLVKAVADRIVLFEVHRAPAGALRLAEVLVKSAEQLVRATGLLSTLTKGKHASEILQVCVEINGLEKEADTIYRASIAELFKPGNDALVVMKWNDIFDKLETATDRCEDVANVLEGVVLEYS